MKLGFQRANQLTRLMSPEKLASFKYDKNGRMVSEMIKELAALDTNNASVAPSKTSVVKYPDQNDNNSVGIPMRWSLKFHFSRRNPDRDSYGYLDKVLSVNRNGNETKFHYNADGMLVGKQQVSPDSVGGREELEAWVWDGLALAMKDGMTFASEAHISGGAAVLATPVDGEVDDTQMLLNDHLGTTLAIFGKDAPGNVHTTSFGKALGNAGETAMFTGKPYDADLGAHVFAFRNYRSDLARWTSADPAGYPDGPNQQFYAPVPTHGLDPLGLFHSGSSYSSLNPPYTDITDRAAWSTGKAAAGTLQTSAMNHADGGSTGSWTLSGAEAALVKATDKYIKDVYKHVQKKFDDFWYGKANGTYNFSTANYDITFDKSKDTDAYYAFGGARFSTSGTVTVTDTEITYDATVTISDNFTFAGYASVPWYTPTAVGYRLQTNGWIVPFSTSGTFSDTWTAE